MRQILILITTILLMNPVGLLADDDGTEVEGLIEAISADAITVGGISYIVNSDTEFEGEDDAELGWTDFSVGDFVEIVFTTSGESLVALEVEFDDLEVKGVIEAISAESITIDGVTYIINSDTEIEGENDEESSWTDLSVGDFVEVEYLISGGSNIALEIEAEDEDDLEVKGVIESISEDSLVMNGKSYALNDATEYEDEEDNEVLRTFFSAGMIVEVEYALVDSQRVALGVEEESADTDDDSSVDDDDEDVNGKNRVFEKAKLGALGSTVDSSLKGKVSWRFREKPKKNRTKRRLKGKLLVPVPATVPAIADRTAARNAQFFLTLYRNNIAYAQCYFEFDEFEQKNAGEFAEYKLDIRLRTRDGRNPRFRAKKGSCDTDLATSGVQSDMPDVQTGDTVIVGDSDGDYLSGAL